MLTADTHVHFYPAYPAETFFRDALANLAAAAGSSGPYALLLTERRDGRAFEQLASGSLTPGGFSVEPAGSAEALLLTGETGSLFLFAGHQYVTSEGIEILSLVCAERQEENRPARETAARIRDAGGIPVVSWSPGKWLGRRGRVVRDLIENRGDGPLLLGDTAMRPAGFPEPGLFKAARLLDMPVAAGTDPLPFAADASIAGRYGIQSGAFDPAEPASSMRELLKAGAFTVCGRRCGMISSARRWIANHRSSGS